MITTKYWKFRRSHIKNKHEKIQMWIFKKGINKLKNRPYVANQADYKVGILIRDSKVRKCWIQSKNMDPLTINQITIQCVWKKIQNLNRSEAGKKKPKKEKKSVCMKQKEVKRSICKRLTIFKTQIKIGKWVRNNKQRSNKEVYIVN